MRILVVSVAAIALSGCSWLGIGDKASSQWNTASQYKVKKSKKNCCVGGKTLSRWNVEAGVGVENFVGGEFLTASEINPIPGVVGNDLSVGSAYGTGSRFEVGASRALSPNRKITITGNHVRADGNSRTLGAVNGTDITGEFSDYRSFGVDVGLRQYAKPIPAPWVGALRGYAEGKVGFSRVNDLNVDVDPIALDGEGPTGVPTAGGTLALYDSGFVPTAGAFLGVETPVAKRWTMGVETGIRYRGPQESSEIPNTAAFAGVNNGNSAWTVPVTIRGRYRF